MVWSASLAPFSTPFAFFFTPPVYCIRALFVVRSKDGTTAGALVPSFAVQCNAPAVQRSEPFGLYIFDVKKKEVQYPSAV